MGRFAHACLIGALLVVMGACTPQICNTGSGSVDTYQIFGTWKLTSGYAEPRSEEELKLNYDVLVIKPGNVACRIRAVNGTLTEYVWQATYSNNVERKELTFERTDGQTDQLVYSFAGNCSSTAMNWTFTDAAGGALKWRIISTTSDTDCTGEESN